MFYANHVDLVLAGHMHSYDRSCAVYKGECVPGMLAATVEHADMRQGGVVYVMIGMAGAPLDFFFYLESRVSQYRDKDSFGYTRATAFNATHLQFTYYHNAVCMQYACRMHARDGAQDNAVADQFWLVK